MYKNTQRRHSPLKLSHLASLKRQVAFQLQLLEVHPLEGHRQLQAIECELREAAQSIV